MVLEKKYVSLQEASTHCDYSQEYLSLRARRGKLKSVKNGRNWVTTLEWLQDYIMNTEAIKAEIKKVKEAKQANRVEQKIPVTIVEKPKITPAPENLPIEKVLVLNQKKLNTKPSSLLLLSSFIILFFSSVIFGKDSILQSLNYFSVASQITGNAGDIFMKESALSVRKTVLDAKSFESLAIQNISEKISQASLVVALSKNPSPKNLVSGIQNLTSKNISDINQIDRLEMRDQDTGAIYCTWIEDGWWVKIQSACKDVPQKNFSDTVK